jgi:hypothetical protein
VPLGQVDLGAGASKQAKWNQRVGWFATSILYGASYTFGDNDSRGVHVRYVLAIPRVDVQLSASYGVRSYHLRGGARETTYPVSYGVETGFGFFLLHLGVTEEFSQSPLTHKLKPAKLFRTGVTLVLPKSVYRVPFQFLGRKLRRRHGSAG